ncbi:MAG: hypothetical protein NVSMB39_7420 [Candidatus Saccharimonadales bacterium]
MTVHLENRMFFIPPVVEEDLKSLVKTRYLSTDAAVRMCVTHGNYVLRALSNEFQLRNFVSATDTITAKAKFGSAKLMVPESGT